jgi:hypothetical protein
MQRLAFFKVHTIRANQIVAFGVSDCMPIVLARNKHYQILPLASRAAAEVFMLLDAREANPVSNF